MQLLYWIKDSPVRSAPVVILSTEGGPPFMFRWDQQRSAHVRRYNLDDPAELKRLHRDQVGLFNQKLHFPIFTAIENTVGDASLKVPASALVEANDLIAQKDLAIAALQDELATLRAKKPAKRQPVAEPAEV